MNQITSEQVTLNLPSVSLETKQCLPRFSGIYFVLENSEVIYIGRSQNLQRRWLNHHKMKEFSARPAQLKIAWLECDAAILATLESTFIELFKPELNKAFGGVTKSTWQSKWKSGKTKTVRVPVVLVEVLLAIARAVDEGRITFEQIYQKYPQMKPVHTDQKSA